MTMTLAEIDRISLLAFEQKSSKQIADILSVGRSETVTRNMIIGICHRNHIPLSKKKARDFVKVRPKVFINKVKKPIVEKPKPISATEKGKENKRLNAQLRPKVLVEEFPTLLDEVPARVLYRHLYQNT
jgi:hypothetical protein